jgi:hypothetical protein
VRETLPGAGKRFQIVGGTRRLGVLGFRIFGWLGLG